MVANAGLLDGKRATAHWYVLHDMLKQHPSIQYVENRRLVVDRGVATTTGIIASMTMSLVLIEAIAGHDKAAAVAQELGVQRWGIRHSTAVFKFTRPFALTAMRNKLAFWNHQEFGLGLKDGDDEVTLALVADAWSRTFRSRAVAIGPTMKAIESRNGMRILPEQEATGWPAKQLLEPVGNRAGDGGARRRFEPDHRALRYRYLAPGRHAARIHAAGRALTKVARLRHSSVPGHVRADK